MDSEKRWPLVELHRTKGDEYPNAPGPLGVEDPRESEIYVPESAPNVLSEQEADVLQQAMRKSGLGTYCEQYRELTRRLSTFAAEEADK